MVFFWFPSLAVTTKEKKKLDPLVLFFLHLPMIGSRPILAHPRSTPVSRTLARRLTCSRIRASSSESTTLVFLSLRKKFLIFEPVDSCVGAGTVTMWSWAWEGLVMVVGGGGGDGGVEGEEEEEEEEERCVRGV